jgi:signal transduction histidine kinase
MRAWLVLVCCLLPIVAGAAALTVAVARAERSAAVRDRDRLALWRLDAAVLPVFAAEAGRDARDWRPFREATAYNDLYQNQRTLVPSPLLALPSPPLWLHVELGADGTLRSPQVPEGNARDVAEGLHGLGPGIAAAEGRLASSGAIADGLRRWLEPERPPRRGAPAPAAGAAEAEAAQANALPAAPLIQAAELAAAAPAAREFQSRSQQAAKVAANSPALNGIPAPPPAAGGPAPQPGPMTAHWIAGSLVLVRRTGPTVQAVICDWAAWRRDLLATVADLVPGADLRPVADDPLERRMAALPVALVVPAEAPPLPATTVAVLGLAWAGVAIGIVAAAVLLAVARMLSERRAAFVSAVTHELRTPLTALRLHADLLHADPARAGERAPVIRGAAARLAHLVDNVLDYARIERRALPAVRAIAVADLLGPVLPLLAERLAAAGLDLEPGPLPAAMVRAEPGAVGRILVNLADNAAKYAAAGGRVELLVAVGAAVEIRLRDHGPGLDPATRRRLFRPFHRSAEAAAGNAPGVGLGLALGRRLARAMGGDLRSESPAEGAGLVMVLRLARAA